MAAAFGGSPEGIARVCCAYASAHAWALAAIVAQNPFDDQLPEFGKRMYVCFLENAPDAKAIAAIAPYTNPEEQLQVHGSEAFVYYAGGLGKAKLTNAIIERRLGMATMRNWNTVNTLLELSKPN
ncbi:MAG: DUF1697 domain-containing protein [Bacteroidetes bacterium]|nr:DUF1697 domain-containing protein [Bacteroidota bacterium]